MSADTHFEIYVKKNRKAGWNLDQALHNRKQALELAKEKLAACPQSSVRVTKETYNQLQNSFLSVAIFEGGEERHKRIVRADNKMEPPCVMPEDLYALHARRTMSRALRPWLERNTVCVLELLHSSALAEKLAAAGHDRQHAIQKVAIAQAGAQECSVQHIVRRLTEIADAATDQLRKAEHLKRTAKFDERGFAATCEAIRNHKEPVFALNSALAARLGKLRSWPEKISFLASCVSDALVDCAKNALSFAALDGFLSEMVSIVHALDACVDAETLGDRLDLFTDITRGQPPKAASDSARMLAIAISSGRLPQTQSMLAARIFAELRGPRRLYPERFEDEVTLNRSLADRLVRLPPALVLPEQLNEAFIIRSSRLLESGSVENLLSKARHPGAEMLTLADFEASMVGAQNKRKLAAFLRAIIGAHKTDRWLGKDGKNDFKRLAVCTQVQKRVLSGGFCENDKIEIAEALDRLCFEAMTRTGVLKQIERRNAPALQKAISLMQLSVQSLIPEGKCCTEANYRAMALLRSHEGRKAMQDSDDAQREQLASLMKKSRTKAA